MRILRVAQRAYPEVTGGGPYHVHAMSRDQAAMGHDVTLLTVDDGYRRTGRTGYEVIRRAAVASPLGNDIAPGVATYLARHASDYDVVHAHSHLYSATNFAAVASVLTAVPFAVTNHGLFSQNAPEHVFRLYLNSVGRWTFNAADTVFCYTNEDEGRLREFGVSSDITVVPNGIDTTRFTPEGPAYDQLPEASPLILFVGRLVEGKQPGDAISAFARLRETHPTAELVVCGDGPLKPHLTEQVSNLGLKDAVTFLGHLSYEEMPAVYRGVDALILPSRAEGLPRAVLEALGSGVPVVVSNLEQVAPVVNGVGRAVPLGDINRFTTALEQVLGGTKRSPRSVVEDQYDWSSTVTETTARLQELSNSPDSER